MMASGVISVRGRPVSGGETVWRHLRVIWGGVMDLILHVGAHRTATTSFHRFLARNEAVLKDAGIAFWGPKQTRSRLFANSLSEAHARRRAGAIQLAEAEEKRSGVNTLIVSEPNLIGRQMENYRLATLYPQAEYRMQRVAGAFRSRMARVVLSIRNYEHYWTSVMARAIPLGAAAPDPARLDRLVTQPRRWRDIAAELRRTFPQAKLVIAPFERVGATPERLLHAMVDAPVEGATIGTRERHRNSPSRVEIATALLDREEIADVTELDWPPFPAEHRAALRLAYAEDLQAFENMNDPLMTFINGKGQSPDRTDERGLNDDGEEFPLAGTGGRGAAQSQAR